MTVYITNLLISCLICSAVQQTRNWQKRLGIKKSSPGLFLLFLIWVSMFTFRYRVGADSWTFNSYLPIFRASSISLKDHLFQTRDKLYAFIYYVCIKTLDMKRVWFQMVLAVLLYAPMIKVFEERDDSLVFSVFLYCTLLTCYQGYNGTRQAIALSYIMLAYYKYFLKHDYKRYAIVMLIAFGFHSATLFAVPFHFLSSKPLRSNWVKLSIIGLLFSVIFLRPLWSVLINFLDTIGQNKMANDYAGYVEKGANILRLFVSLIPLILVLMRFPVLKQQDPGVEPLVILSVFGVIIKVFMMRNAIFARVSNIVDISDIFLLPRIPGAFDKSTGDTIKTCMIILYFLYMVLILLSGDSHLYPYQFLPNLDATW